MRRNEKSQQMIPAGVVIRTNTQSHMMAAGQDVETVDVTSHCINSSSIFCR